MLHVACRFPQDDALLGAAGGEKDQGSIDRSPEEAGSSLASEAVGPTEGSIDGRNAEWVGLATGSRRWWGHSRQGLDLGSWLRMTSWAE